MKTLLKQSKLRLVSAVFAFLMFAGVARADIWVIHYCTSDILGTYTATSFEGGAPDGSNVVIIIAEDC